MATALATLPEREQRLKLQLESKIAENLETGKRCHFLIGEALDAILDLKLYRGEFSSFDSYCETQWGFSGAIGRRSADTYRVAKTLAKAEQDCPALFWSMLTGLGAGHADALKKLPDDVQPIAWSEARQSTTTPTVKALEAVVEKHKGRLAELPNMTAAEESSFNAEVESETLEAYQNGELREVAETLAKRMRSVRRGIPLALEAKMAAVIRFVDAATKEFERLAS